MRYFYLTILIVSIGTVQAGLFLNLKDDVLAIWEERHAQSKTTGVTKEKRTFRRYLVKTSNNTKLQKNNDTGRARNKRDKENSTDVETTKDNHNKHDAAMAPVFRTEIDNQIELSPKDNKISHNKTVILKTRASKKYTKHTASEDSPHRLPVTMGTTPFSNNSKMYAAKVKFKTRKDKNLTNVLKKENHSKFNFTKDRFEISSGRNKSNTLGKKEVTKVFSKVTRKLKQDANSTLPKTEHKIKSEGIFREDFKDIHVSKYHNMYSDHNNTALMKGRLLEKFMDAKRHNVTQKHKKRDNTLEFRGHTSENESESLSFSSNMDKITWMEEFNDHWMQKKFEALNSTLPRGDVANMVAARPWGVPCGDPGKFDMPLGSCTLPGECDPEFRIYRGDHTCGRTSFVCCALIMTNYDFYQALDISLAGSSASTDSTEKNERNAAVVAHKKRKLERYKLKKQRRRRKRLIKKNIKSIITAFKKILNFAYRNKTSESKKRSEKLLKLIKHMKKEFTKDRTALIKIHQYDMLKMDDQLEAKLNQLRPLHTDFMTNDTFRKIVMNEKIDKEKLKQFLRLQPMRAFMNFLIGKANENTKLAPIKRANKRKSKKRDLRKRRFQKRNSRKRISKKLNNTHDKRRSGIDLNLALDEGEQDLVNVKPPNVDYDIEYGVLYY